MAASMVEVPLNLELGGLSIPIMHIAPPYSTVRYLPYDYRRVRSLFKSYSIPGAYASSPSWIFARDYKTWDVKYLWTGAPLAARVAKEVPVSNAQSNFLENGLSIDRIASAGTRLVKHSPPKDGNIPAALDSDAPKNPGLYKNGLAASVGVRPELRTITSAPDARTFNVAKSLTSSTTSEGCCWRGQDQKDGEVTHVPLVSSASSALSELVTSGDLMQSLDVMDDLEVMGSAVPLNAGNSTQIRDVTDDSALMDSAAAVITYTIQVSSPCVTPQATDIHISTPAIPVSSLQSKRRADRASILSTGAERDNGVVESKRCGIHVLDDKGNVLLSGSLTEDESKSSNKRLRPAEQNGKNGEENVFVHTRKGFWGKEGLHDETGSNKRYRSSEKSSSSKLGGDDVLANTDKALSSKTGGSEAQAKGAAGVRESVVDDGEVGCVHRNTAQATAADNAATKIQAVFRGNLVLKAETLKCLRKIRQIRMELSNLQNCVSKPADFENLRSNAKEALKITEGAMALLLQLDAMQRLDSSIREMRKSLANDIVHFLEQVDAALKEPSQEDSPTENKSILLNGPAKSLAEGGNKQEGRMQEELNNEIECEDPPPEDKLSLLDRLTENLTICGDDKEEEVEEGRNTRTESENSLTLRNGTSWTDSVIALVKVGDDLQTNRNHDRMEDVDVTVVNNDNSVYEEDVEMSPDEREIADPTVQKDENSRLQITQDQQTQADGGNDGMMGMNGGAYKNRDKPSLLEAALLSWDRTTIADHQTLPSFSESGEAAYLLDRGVQDEQFGAAVGAADQESTSQTPAGSEDGDSVVESNGPGGEDNEQQIGSDTPEEIGDTWKSVPQCDQPLLENFMIAEFGGNIHDVNADQGVHDQ